MRVLGFILLLSIALGGCAYRRHTTPLHPVPNVRVTSKDRPGGMYSLRLIGAESLHTPKSGLAWDDDGTGPDPFVRLYVDDRLVWESPVVQDSDRPQWDVAVPRNVEVGSSAMFRLELWDRDTAVSADPIGRIERRGLPTSAAPGAIARLQLDSKAVLVLRVGEPVAHKGVGLSVELRSEGLKVLSVETHSPAGRAGIRPGELIVGIGTERVAHMNDDDAASELSLASDRGHKLMVADSDGKNEREVNLDKGFTWLTM
ncbi:MAG: PDZ domain-containing protein [Myxococcales bacterium]|nr:PDZ domain-containing protein [Myxococcales bacterium]